MLPEVAEAIDSIEALTWDESQHFTELEATVSRGINAFHAAGAALLEIRDRRLYRVLHSTFEDYCEARWKFSRPQAYRLIGSAEVIGNLSPMGDTPLPANERQARALAKLDPEEQREAWREAVATAPNGVVTGAHVTAVVAAFLPRFCRDCNQQMPPYHKDPNGTADTCSACVKSKIVPLREAIALAICNPKLCQSPKTEIMRAVADLARTGVSYVECEWKNLRDLGVIVKKSARETPTGSLVHSYQWHPEAEEEGKRKIAQLREEESKNWAAQSEERNAKWRAEREAQEATRRAEEQQKRDAAWAEIEREWKQEVEASADGRAEDDDSEELESLLEDPEDTILANILDDGDDEGENFAKPHTYSEEQLFAPIKKVLGCFLDLGPQWADKEWEPSVYMGCVAYTGYGNDVGDWVEELTKRVLHGQVTEAIAVLPAWTHKDWFQRFGRLQLIYSGLSVCFLKGNMVLQYGRHEPFIAVYFGKNADIFDGHFRNLGLILYPEAE